MRNNIELVQIFVSVVKSGGFTKAAEAMRLPKSTVSKAVTRLEEETGTRLLLRTTRSQTLTAPGKAFYDSCVGPIQAIEDARRSLSGDESLLTGTMKITAPEDLGNEVLAAAAGALTLRHPGLNFDFVYTDRVLDLVKEGFDLAVRIGTLKESGLKAKKVGEVVLILVASPAYVQTNKRISKIQDLRDHSCLMLSIREVMHKWKVQPRIQSNQMSSLVRSALAHAGVAMVPAYLARPYLESGRLVRVLPSWSAPGMNVSLLSPLPFSASARLRMTADCFVAELQKALRVP